MLLSLFTIFLCVLATALANTEIVNIVASEDNTNLLAPSSWYAAKLLGVNDSDWHDSSRAVLSEETPDISLDVSPAVVHTSIIDVCEPPSASCPHEVWAVLDLDSPSWRELSKFTLRISWPANVSLLFRSRYAQLTTISPSIQRISTSIRSRRRSCTNSAAICWRNRPYRVCSRQAALAASMRGFVSSKRGCGSLLQTKTAHAMFLSTSYSSRYTTASSPRPWPPSYSSSSPSARSPCSW